jgi:hypothetical protein
MEYDALSISFLGASPLQLESLLYLLNFNERMLCVENGNLMVVNEPPYSSLFKHPRFKKTYGTLSKIKNKKLHATLCISSNSIRILNAH